MALVKDVQKSGLTEVQLKAASMLAMGCATVEIARECEVDRSTIWHWRKNPAFRAQLDTLLAEAKERTDEIIPHDITQIKELVLGTLLDVARNSKMDAARVSAAKTLGNYVEKYEERAKHADSDLMADKSGEIKAILEHIRKERIAPSDNSDILQQLK